MKRISSSAPTAIDAAGGAPSRKAGVLEYYAPANAVLEDRLLNIYL